MAKKKVSAEARRAIMRARSLIEQVAKSDGNEAETRRRVERILENVAGYDLGHLSRERAVKGAGTTEHVDFVMQAEEGPDAKPIVMVELKRVGVDLAPKHLRQACSYAINAGAEWVLLTNGREWRLYHVEFGQPPITKLVEQWNLMRDDIASLTTKFELISLKSVRKGGLDDLWKKTQVLAPESILAAVLSMGSLRQARRVLRKNTDVLVDIQDIVRSFKRLLNESAAKTLDAMQLQIPEGRRPGRPSAAAEPSQDQAAQFICELCGRPFKSKHALGIHRGHAHKDKEKAVGESVGQAPTAEPHTSPIPPEDEAGQPPAVQ